MNEEFLARIQNNVRAVFLFCMGRCVLGNLHDFLSYLSVSTKQDFSNRQSDCSGIGWCIYSRQHYSFPDYYLW
ncbi:MAG: hypothetical protein ABR990_06345, partial [Terracidiphilus sp.]